MADLTAAPANLLPHRTPTQLLALARAGLAEAAHAQSDGLRYAAGHLAALRAAAAIVAVRSRPARRTNRVPSVWILLPQVAPEFAEWAVYFAEGGSKRAAVEAGIPRIVTATEADALAQAAETFVTAVERAVEHG